MSSVAIRERRRNALIRDDETQFSSVSKDSGTTEGFTVGVVSNSIVVGFDLVAIVDRRLKIACEIREI